MPLRPSCHHRKSAGSQSGMSWLCYYWTQVPYAGLSGIQAALAVMHRGLRPDIPSHTPTPLAQLIQARLLFMLSIDLYTVSSPVHPWRSKCPCRCHRSGRGAGLCRTGRVVSLCSWQLWNQAACVLMLLSYACSGVLAAHAIGAPRLCRGGAAFGSHAAGVWALTGQALHCHRSSGTFPKA